MPSQLRATAPTVVAALVVATGGGDGGGTVRAATSNWTAAGSGNFATPSNWDIAPGAADLVVFRKGGGSIYTVTFVGNPVGQPAVNYATDRLIVGSNHVTFANSPPASQGPAIYTLNTVTTAEIGRGIIVGETAADTSALLTVNLMGLSTTAATLAEAAGSSGTMTVGNGCLFSVTGNDPGNSELIIGNRGAGTLNVNTGGDVVVGDTAVLGGRAGGTGTLNVAGGGSTFSLTGDFASFTIGSAGAGTMNITGGGFAGGGFFTNVGTGAGGNVTVSGAGSTFSPGILRVGNGNTGTLHVSNGGRVLASSGGSPWSVAAGNGSSVGHVTVDGPATVWDSNTHGVSVGLYGNGTFAVTNGAQVSSGGIDVGSLPGSVGTVTINGSGSRWSNAGAVNVGYHGTGTLTATAGAVVTSTNAAVGLESGGTGTVLLDGAGGGATWHNTGLFYVGYAGNGTMNVLRGADVTSLITVVSRGGFDSRLTVDGAGSTWTTDDQLQVGAAGIGVLSVLEGGQMTTGGNAYVGFEPLSSGSINVDGAGSTWSCGGSLYLGLNGDAALDVSNAATVNVAGHLRMSVGTFHSSTINLTGGGTLTVGGDVTDGGPAFSALIVSGGTLDLQGHRIGDGGPNPIDFLDFRAGVLKNVAQINGGAGLTKTTAGTLVLDGTNTYTGVTTVSAGTLVFNTSYTSGTGLDVADGAVARVAASGAPAANKRVLKTPSLNTHASGKLEMNDNDLLIDYTGASVEGAIRELVTNGRASGVGITSTPGTPDDDKVLAVADNAQLNKTAWLGVAIDTSTIIGKYTYFGDANLDGKVTGDDYLNVDANLGTGDSWLEGDFNMSGVTTGDDYLAIDANLGKGTANPLAFAELKEEMVALHVAMFGDEYLVKLAAAEVEGFGASVVPEPSGIAGAVALIGGLFVRRRRAV